jgi:hypothetical protein
MQVLDYQSPRTQQPRHPPTFGARMIKAAAFASIATIIGATMFAWLWIALAIAIWAAILIAHRRRNLKRDHSSIPDGPPWRLGDHPVSGYVVDLDHRMVALAIQLPAWPDNIRGPLCSHLQRLRRPLQQLAQ